MKTYLAMINEEKLKKVVASADKSDFVFIFYFSGNDNISLSMFKELSSAKCKVEFVEVSSDTQLAFEVGKLSVKHAPFTCLSDNPVLVESSKLSGGIKPVVRKAKAKAEDVTNAITAKAEPVKKAVKEKTEPVVKTVKEKTAPAIKAAKEKAAPAAKAVKDAAAVAKKKVSSKTKKAEDDFDKKYDELTAILTSCETKQINPVDHIATIFKSVKLMDSEKIEFAEALSRNTNKTTADKLNKAIPAVILTSVIDLVSTMADSI